jgi:hypothetical protein
MTRRMKTDEELAESFWSRVDRRGPDECWPWMAARLESGHGITTVRGIRARTAHRIAWTLTNGPPKSDAALVCHTCDNPPCCNPRHLYLGDNRANMLDMYRRGRVQRLRGEGHPMAKLTERDVREIRTSTESSTEVAARYGVTIAAVSRIRLRRCWKHVA